MTQKIGSFIADLEGKALTVEEREIFAHPLLGGIILFTRNYESREQLKDLCKEIRAIRKTPFLIMVDQEGGRVQRFIPEFTRLPPMALFGKSYEASPESACHLAKDCAWLLASELLSVGVDFSLAPVLDLDKGVSSVIGTRAFHRDPAVVTELCHAFIQGFQEAGMAAIGKHFPGHGSVDIDSHLAMPIDQRTYGEIEKSDLLPFTNLIKMGIAGLMAAHITFSAVDTQPVGFSSRWLKTILREQFGFTGLIFSDDLNMEGANISANYAERFLAARAAGCDFVMLCNNRKGAIQVLDHLPYTSHLIEAEKWSHIQGRFSHVQQPLHKNQRWQAIQKKILQYSPSLS